MSINTNHTMNDNVNHPNHYQSDTGLEVIDVIEAFCKNLNGVEAFCIANAIKYLCRFDKKNGVEDLKKAQWYIDYVIDARTPADRTEPNTPCHFAGRRERVSYGFPNDHTKAIEKSRKEPSLKKLMNSIYGASIFGVDTDLQYNKAIPILYKTFETESDAYLALKELDDFAKKNGHITIADVYSILNLRVKDGECYKARGWRDTTGFKVKQNYLGWEVIGPVATEVSAMNVVAPYTTTDVTGTYALYVSACKQILDTYIIASAETYEAFEVFETAIKNHTVERPVTASDAEKIAKTFGVSLHIPTDLPKAGILWATQDDWYVEDEYHHEDGSVSFSLRAPLWYQHKILEFRNNHHIAFDQAMDTYRESANDIKED